MIISAGCSADRVPVIESVPCKAEIHAHLEAGLACKLAARGVNVALVGEDVHKLQIVPLASRKVIGVMRRGDLHSSSPKRHVYKLCVCDDGNLPAVQGVHNMLPMQVGISAYASAVT